MDRKNVPYMPKIGTRCSVRGETGHWRIINYVHEGIVEKCCSSSNTVPAMSITPPTLNPIVDSTPTNFDVNLQHEKSFDIHMFTGNISNSSITVNIYQKQ